MLYNHNRFMMMINFAMKPNYRKTSYTVAYWLLSRIIYNNNFLCKTNVRIQLVQRWSVALTDWQFWSGLVPIVVGLSWRLHTASIEHWLTLYGWILIMQGNFPWADTMMGSLSPIWPREKLPPHVNNSCRSDKIQSYHHLHHLIFFPP